jgi:NadR type nicotinamide-nucleotide adenylyltransferase
MAPLPRLCLTGPESTGKTELARALAQDLGTIWIPEYAREYAEARENQLTAEDVEPIARGVIESHERLSSEGRGIVILDTDLISTVVYARHYYERCPGWIEEAARARRADMYLLLDTDVPWHPDVARDAAGDTPEDLFDAFRQALDEFVTKWEIVSGEWAERRHAARAAAAGLHPRSDR